MGKDRKELAGMDIKGTIAETREQLRELKYNVSRSKARLKDLEEGDGPVTVSRQEAVSAMRELVFLQDAFLSFGTMITDRADECRKEIKKKEKKKAEE